MTGPGAAAAFAGEPGGHRWQRVPPSEKRGRVQTSTITVTVLEDGPAAEVRIAPGDLEWTAIRGSGAGGQKRNKTSNAVQLRHLPTGTLIRCEGERSLTQNKAAALAALEARLGGAARAAATTARREERRGQHGSGERGDKVRTIRAADDLVTDHRTGRTWSLRRYLKGETD